MAGEKKGDKDIVNHFIIAQSLEEASGQVVIVKLLDAFFPGKQLGHSRGLSAGLVTVFRNRSKK